MGSHRLAGGLEREPPGRVAGPLGAVAPGQAGLPDSRPRSPRRPLLRCARRSMSSPHAVKAIRDAVRGAEQNLVGLSHDLHAHPEVAWEEHRSADRVAAHLADAGFSIETNYLGLDTAFAARAGSGPLHLVICAEYDALPGLGHACGHNIIAATSVGAAIALAGVAADLGIGIRGLGTPARE